MNSSVQTLQNAQAGNANGAVMNVSQYSSLGLQVIGAGFTGTVNFEASFDGGNNWAPVPMQKSDGTWTSTATASGIFVAPNAAIFPAFRARTSGVTGGTVTVLTMANE